MSRRRGAGAEAAAPRDGAAEIGRERRSIEAVAAEGADLVVERQGQRVRAA